jgi:type IV secretion system protein VirB8
MGKLKNLFQKKTLLGKLGGSSVSKEHDLITDVKNWYSDRYEMLLVQRNILFLFVMISIFSIFAGVFVVGDIAAGKKIEPFIVEIEDKTGITNVVNPATREELTADEALQTYFLMKYVRARETYNSVDYEYNYKTVVRLLSAPKVYGEFWSYINSDPKNAISSYGTTNSTSLKLRSLQFPERGKTAQVRFTITEQAGSRLSFYKIATITYEFSVLELTTEERQVNPLGFQITNYSVADEVVS